MLYPPSLQNNTTNVVIKQNSRKLLAMDILMSERFWARKKWNKIARDIKLVFYSSTTGYIRLHVSAVTRPSSGQQGIVLVKVHSSANECTLINTIPCWPDDGRVTAETCSRM